MPLFISPSTVVTNPPTEVTSNTAALSGKIVSTGFGNITESGILIYPADGSVERQMLSDPANSEKYYSDNTSDADISLYIRNLIPNTSYHYMAFATNEAGTAYGEMKELMTSYGTVNDSEGNLYQTIRIGDQVWMRENMRSTIYSDGSKIKGIYESSRDGTFGKHYTWQAAMGLDFTQASAHDVCPVGWHLPSDADWQKLLTYAGVPSGELKTIGMMGDNQAALLKESATGYWKNENTSNSTGFSVLPAGVVAEKGDNLSVLTAFWTRTPYMYYGFQQGSGRIVRGSDPDSKAYFSVRCLKD
jgi:uncharacterized protein (TIGR02145 family)